jgi:hypothetical protein
MVPIMEKTIERLSSLTAEQLRDRQALGYVRLVCLRHKYQGYDSQALEEFRNRWPESPLLFRLEREWRTKVSVAAATTTDSTWGGPLALASSASDGLGAMVKAATILGRLPVRRVPLNSLLPVWTAGATVSWAGQNLQKAMSAAALNSITLAFFKAVAFSSSPPNG